MGATPVIEVRQDDPANPALAALLAAHVAEQRAAVPPGFAYVLDIAALRDPAITFWSAWDGAAPAGMAALKALGGVTTGGAAGATAGGTAGEVKSMRVAGAWRGRGVGHALLSAIVAAAHARGYRRLFLETGTAPAYDAALALYRRAGFVACDAFADYRPSPHNQFLTLALQPPIRRPECPSSC